MLTTLPSQLVFDADIDAASSLTDGIWLASELPAALKDASGQLRNIVVLGALKGNHHRGVDLIPLLSDDAADGNTVTITIHRLSAIMDRGSLSTIRAYRSEKLYTITAALASTQTYAAGDVHETNAYRGIDTLPAATKTSRADDLESKTGASLVLHSPGDNTPAVITIPDMDGAHAIAIEAEVTTGGGAFNCLAEVKT